jgi:uncharacterized protein with von Willebrand factor type A (vWA) domain
MEDTVEKKDLLDLFQLDDIQTEAKADPTSDVEKVNTTANTVYETDEFIISAGLSVSKFKVTDKEDKDKDVEKEIGAFKSSDSFNIHYTPDEILKETPGEYKDNVFKIFLDEYKNSEEFKKLKDTVELDKDLASVASLFFNKSFITLVEDMKKKGMLEDYDPSADEPSEKKLSAKETKELVRGAEKTSKESEDEMHREGGPAEKKSSNTPMDRMAEIFKKIKNNRKLLSITNIAGVLKEKANTFFRYKYNNMPQEVRGITVGNEIQKIIPSELLGFLDPDLEILNLLKLAESKLWIKDLFGYEMCSRGPIVVVIDESGSMHGEKETFAKALALTIYTIAKKQGRWVSLIAFSGHTGHRMYTSKASISFGEDKLELLNWFQEFISGGSHTDVPVAEMPGFFSEIKAPKGKTDLVYITDDQSSISAEQAKVYNDWKASVDAKLISLILRSNGDTLKCISDKIYPNMEYMVDETKEVSEGF